MKSVDFIVIFLSFFQMIVAAVIARRNAGIFDKYPVHQYFAAFLLLKEKKPLAAYVLCLMYALIPLEFFVLYAFFS